MTVAPPLTCRWDGRQPYAVAIAAGLAALFSGFLGLVLIGLKPSLH